MTQYSKRLQYFFAANESDEANQMKAILVNGHFAPPATADEKVLTDGDVLAVWPPVAGG